MNDLPKSLLAAVRYFSDLKVCNAYMRKIKWPSGTVTCPKCGGESISDVKGRPLLQCNTRDCKKQFSYKVGTIFENSPLGLDKWLVAVWFIANSKNGISSHELARALDVTQKTAWFMLHRIREAMQTGTFRKMDGEIEVDETFIGGDAKNMHRHIREKKIRGRGTVSKAIVQGALERGGELITQVVRDTEGETLRAIVNRNVEPGAQVYTDAHQSYLGLSRRWLHAVIDHSVAFVRGNVHTNGIENFWSLFKRSIHGTWTHVAAFHLQRYCWEQTWRFNNRKTSDAARFAVVMGCVVGRRITYRRLCAIDDCGFMGIQ